MDRIIWHWTGGGHRANGSDKRHYHFIIEANGNVVDGNHPPEANEVIEKPSDGSTYAAHTRRLNTKSIGIALAGMRNAQEAPLDWGSAPITQPQIDALIGLTCRLSQKYGIPITPQTTLSHAEVEPTLGVKQRGKWDITVLPGATAVSDPVHVGRQLRAACKEFLGQLPDPYAERNQPAKPLPKGPIGLIIAAILALAAFLGLR